MNNKFLTITLGALFFCAINTIASDPGFQDDIEHLKKPREISHHQYQAAKSMCLHAVHSQKDQVGEREALRLLDYCSKGLFDHVMLELEAGINTAVNVVMTDEGYELIADWEIYARDAIQHLDVLDSDIKNNKK